MQEELQAKLDRIVSLKAQRDAIDAELHKELGIVLRVKAISPQEKLRLWRAGRLKRDWVLKDES